MNWLPRYADCGTILRVESSAANKIESADRRDLNVVASLLAESLFDDSLQQWLFPDAKGRLATTTRMFRHLLKSKLAVGLVRIVRDGAGELASVAVWTPPSPPAPSRFERYAESFFMRVTYGRRIHEVREAFTKLAARHPPQPYWYLHALATRPDHRGQGLAGRLLDEKSHEPDSQGVPTALETSSTANVAYYERLGFTVIDEARLTPGLPVWLMCRSASTN
jgi:ribosomal protein S18 acetylase RimI-like enzyme